MKLKTLKIIGKIASAAMVLMGLGCFVMYLIGGQALYDNQWAAAYGAVSPYSVIWPELWSLVIIACGIYDWKLVSD